MNCELQPNPDVSGIGVRWALYIQVFLALVMSHDSVPLGSLTEIVLANVSVQVAAVALILAASLDSTIDIPHSVIVAQFVVMLSSCRYTAFDFPASFLQSSIGVRTTNWLWLLDLVCRPMMLWFKCSVWTQVRRVQLHGLCPQGAGNVVIFGVSDVSAWNVGCLAMLVFSILDAVWECLRWVGEVTRLVRWIRRNQQNAAPEIAFDARLWWVYATVRRILLGRQLDWERTCRITSTFSWLIKLAIFVYILTTTEVTVTVNNLGQLEDAWTFGQIYAIMMMLVVLVVFGIRFHSHGTASPLPLAHISTSRPTCPACIILDLSYAVASLVYLFLLL